VFSPGGGEGDGGAPRAGGGGGGKVYVVRCVVRGVCV
jgi:hypothetical protein